MRRLCQPHGFTLIEVLVALVLLSTIALALASTLVRAQRTQRRSARWMQAMELAAEGVEQLRVGSSLGPCPVGFQRSGQILLAGGPAGLARVDVTVEWTDETAYTYQLVTLVRR